jgi:hypothetical protein
MKIEEIKKAIKEWCDIRTSPGTVITYLKQGCCFTIEKSQYERWKQNSPENFYIYMGIFSGKLKLILTDAILEGDLENRKNFIFVQDYISGLKLTEEGFIERAIDGGITVLDGLKKVLRWKVFMDSWVYYKVDTTYGVFEAFRVPFSDLISQFETAECTESLVLFGLDANYQADLTLWGLGINEEQQNPPGNSVTPAPVEDLATPVPPFGG